VISWLNPASSTGTGCFLHEMYDILGIQHVQNSEIEAAALGEDGITEAGVGSRTVLPANAHNFLVFATMHL